jgi:dCTP deaminase
MNATKGLLSRPVIRDYYEKGYITIDPFEEENLGTNSYDVRLGKWCYRERVLSGLPKSYELPYPHTLYNLYDAHHVEKIYELHEATPAYKLFARWPNISGLNGISQDDLITLVKPGESLLTHTQEFIGSNCAFVTTVMAARSSTGRNGLEVCRCAGAGDVFYNNRWTLEITNNLQHHTIPLVVGRRIGQLLFYDVVPLNDDRFGYTANGKYQSSTDLDEMKRNWKPQDMLPKAYLDREAVAVANCAKPK